MVPLARVFVLGWMGAAVACAACGAADSALPPEPTRCDALYYGGGGLPPPPDGPSLCAAGVCNYQLQTGCGDGETCAPHVDAQTATVGPACRPAGALARGAACDAAAVPLAERCGPGLQCAEGACRRFCCGGDFSACDTGESCIRQAQVKVGGAVQGAGADLCFPVGTCQVLDPAACASEGRTCRIADPVGHVACMPPSDLAAGAACDAPSPCGAGLHCVREMLALPGGICRKLCPWGVCSVNTCSSEEGTCVRFDRDPPGIGECTPHWHGEPILVDGGVATEAGLP